jgi:hypothetical protein
VRVFLCVSRYQAKILRIGLPYLKFLKREGKETGEKGNRVGHADFTRLQREALENYLVGLIRAVVCMSHSWLDPG